MDYDPFSQQVLDDPFPVYARLRRESPVHYLERHDAWALALFEDVWRAGEDPEHFAMPGPQLQIAEVASAELADSDQLARTFAGDNLPSMDPPEHTELRGQLSRHFSPNAMRRLEPEMRQRVRSGLAESLPQGRCDMIGLATQLSVWVTARLIGLPREDCPLLAELEHRFFARDPEVQGMPPDAMAAGAELWQHLFEAVGSRRRRGPGAGDVLDVLLGAEVGGVRLADEQIASHLSVLVHGGTETLPKVFAGGVLQLHRHPEQRAALIEHPEWIPDAFTEIARYEMPTQFLTRRVARDLELRGRKLRRGQGVLFLYRSANRDEREYDAPDRFDIRRRPERILSFGHGVHVCLGQHAARLEGRILLEELLKAVPDYRVPEEQVVPARSEFVAGYLELPIVFEPRTDLAS